MDPCIVSKQAQSDGGTRNKKHVHLNALPIRLKTIFSHKLHKPNQPAQRHTGATPLLRIDIALRLRIELALDVELCSA